MTLREAMHAREGHGEAERQIKRGLRAWAVERDTPLYRRPETALVFGTCASDALRRAASPARLGEGVHGDVAYAAPIASGWDEPFDWPTFTRPAVAA